MNLREYPSPRLFKRQIVLFLFALFSLPFLMFFAGKAFSEEKTTEILNDPFLLLAEEQALAENNVFLLNQFGKKNFDQFAEGIKRYGIARSKFNGLIEWMKRRLLEGEPFDQAPAFDKVLKAAVEKRIAFTSFINQKIIGKRTGEKGILKSLIGDPAELITALKDSGKTLWQEYRALQDQRRKELIEQLNALKWKAFQLAEEQR